jgi:GMP synthase (glutamine-hydrolysing)
MRTLAIRHVAFEHLDLLEDILERRGHEIRYLDAGVDPLDDIDPQADDLVVILGGPISIYERDAYPFLNAEVAFAARRLAARKPIIGICLGCQIMAAALGAEVYPSAAREIGWKPLQLTNPGKFSLLGDIAEAPVLHWHGDTFDLPHGTTLLASTDLVQNQAFSIENYALALQFHLEASLENLESWFIGHTLEISITDGINVQNLRADTAAAAPQLEPGARLAFGRWLDDAGL